MVGDGGATYAPQALWSARRESVPVVFVVLDNREYGLLKEQARVQGLTKAAAGRSLPMDLDPPLDFGALAASTGVSSTKVATSATLGATTRAALQRGEASLIHAGLD